MNEDQAVTGLAALAQGLRLRVFRALVQAGPAGLTPGALAAMLPLGASTLSFHLKELTQAGLVTVQRNGRHLIYRPALAQMNALLTYLTEDCCQGQACELRPVAAADVAPCAAPAAAACKAPSSVDECRQAGC